MNQTEHSILQTLVELEQSVKRIATANPKPNLQLLFSRIDQLARELPQGDRPYFAPLPAQKEL